MFVLQRQPLGAIHKWRHAEWGGGVRVRMTNNVEGCIKKHDEGGGGGKKWPKIAWRHLWMAPYRAESYMYSSIEQL